MKRKLRIRDRVATADALADRERAAEAKTSAKGVPK